MMTLEEVKLHLRVDDDHEDTLIGHLLDAATEAAFDHLGHEPDPIPAPVQAAILLAVGDLFANREAVGTQPYSKNPTYERLLNPYRAMAV